MIFHKSSPGYDKDLKKNGVSFEMHMYKKAKHGFHNDSAARYDKENAELAWQRTLAFFTDKLS